MAVLENLEPKNVFKYFEEISQIPRKSGDTKRISDYLVDFAKKHNLEYIQEPCNNVIIKKPATQGYEHISPVMLQGHMDMVCEKNKDTVHNFDKDPIKLIIKDDYIYADNTTLGADDGIAVAYSLAILSDDTIKHPALEVVITVDEETTMLGANELDTSKLKAKYLINLDTENEDELLLSCAGGGKTLLCMPIEYTVVSGDTSCATIKVRGLVGGHSGEMINKNRGNANIIMGRILNELNARVNFEIKDINGGSKNNAIPRECDVNLVIANSDKKGFEDIVKTVEEQIKKELENIDDGFKVEIEYKNCRFDKVFDVITKQRLIDILMLYTSGVYEMSTDIEGLVQTSNNLGVVTTDEEKNIVTFNCAIRSSIDSKVQYLIQKHQAIANLTDSDIKIESVYPGWKYDKNSKLSSLFADTYKKMRGKEMTKRAIHAGLECGIINKKMENLDIVSFGPNMYDIHTPNEHLSISSTKKVYQYLVQCLEDMINIDKY